MQRRDLLLTAWMVVAFAVGAAVYSPLDGVVFALLSTFAFGAILTIRDRYEW